MLIQRTNFLFFRRRGASLDRPMEKTAVEEQSNEKATGSLLQGKGLDDRAIHIEILTEIMSEIKSSLFSVVFFCLFCLFSCILSKWRTSPKFVL